MRVAVGQLLQSPATDTGCLSWDSARALQPAETEPRVSSAASVNLLLLKVWFSELWDWNPVVKPTKALLPT